MKKEQDLGKVDVHEKVEITPEMIEAGAETLRQWFGDSPRFYLVRAAEEVAQSMFRLLPCASSRGQSDDR